MLQFWSVVPLNSQAFEYVGRVQAMTPASAAPLLDPLDDVPLLEPDPDPLEELAPLLDDFAPLLDPLPLLLEAVPLLLDAIPLLLDVEPLPEASTPEPASVDSPLLLLQATAAVRATTTPDRTNSRRVAMTCLPSREAPFQGLRGASRRRRPERRGAGLNV